MIIDPFFWFLALLGVVVYAVSRLIDLDGKDTEIQDLKREVRNLEDDLADGEHYTSTACHHEVHRECRKHCKFCEEPCRCNCHDDETYDDPRNGLPTKPAINWRFWKKPAPQGFVLEKPTYETVERMR